MQIYQPTNFAEVAAILQTTESSAASLPLLTPKALGLAIDLGEHSPSLGNIIKQEALAVGADAAVHEKCSRCEVERSRIVLVGTAKQLLILAAKLQKNVAALPEIGRELAAGLKEKFPELSA
jgi:dihydropteroate synthase